MVHLETEKMADGGFLIKFEGAKAKSERGYALALDYDDWTYSINNEKKKEFPHEIYSSVRSRQR